MTDVDLRGHVRRKQQQQAGEERVSHGRPCLARNATRSSSSASVNIVR
jgi:hypothetical protein